MATQTIRQRETIAIPRVSGNKLERVGEFISVVVDVLRPYVCAPLVAYAERKLPETYAPMEKVVFDAYRWGMPLY